MKYTLSLLMFLVFGLTVNAQSNSNFLSSGASFDCYNCGYGFYDYKIGAKMGIGYGVVKEINSKLDFFVNLGYNIWIYEAKEDSYYGYWYPGQPVRTEIRNDHFLNLAAGGRFHFLTKKRASLYTGLNMNFQSYFSHFQRNFGISAEPTIGWRRFIGSKHEFFTSIGYDQHLTSISRVFKRRPGRVSFNVGFNVKIGGLGARREK